MTEQYAVNVFAVFNGAFSERLSRGVCALFDVSRKINQQK